MGTMRLIAEIGDRMLTLTIFSRLTSLIITSRMDLPLIKGMTTGCALKKKGPGIDTMSRRERTSLETTPVPCLQGGRSRLISTTSGSLIATSSTLETRSIATPVMCMPAPTGLEHTSSGPGLPSSSTRAARPKGGVPLPRSRSAKICYREVRRALTILSPPNAKNVPTPGRESPTPFRPMIGEPCRSPREGSMSAQRGSLRLRSLAPNLAAIILARRPPPVNHS